jgi:TolB-like protein
MSGQTKTPVALEIAHVLFIDIVGYSKLPTTEQHEAIAKLNELVQNTEPFQAAEKADRLLRIPAGDGMALVFYTTPEEPARCAVALSRALKDYPNLRVRMGVHSGSVTGVVDVSGRVNVAGAGINIAQRVMDCGDGGHILLSKHAADDLAEYEHWRPLLHDLGSCEVKHRLIIQLASLWNDEVGNSGIPSKLRAQKELSRRRQRLWLSSAAILVGITTTVFMLWHPWKKPAASGIDRSVAVLPFENLSTNEENAVFAGGVHREILLNLAKVSDLKVISRTSVMQYAAGVTRNLKQIAHELGVSHVVEGSVRRDRDKVRVTAQLIDAGNDTTMWSKAYDGNLADVFTIQNEIAQKITAELGARLSQQERTALSTKLTQNVEAFDLYTKAQLLMDTDPDDLAYGENISKAVQLLEAATKRDPQFTAAYCALSEADTLLFHSKPVEKDCSASHAALSEARRIAPDAGETYFAQALIEYYCDHDHNRALATLEVAARSLPNDSEILTLRGLLERRLGRWKESLRHFTDAINLNPKDPTPYGHAAGGAVILRDYAESRRIMNAAIAAFPGEADSWRGWEGWMAIVADADIAAARQQLQQIQTMNNKSCLGLAFFVPFVERNYAEAEKALAGLINSKIPRIDLADVEASFAIATNRAEEKRASWSTVLKEAAEEIAKAAKVSDVPIKASALLNAALGNKEQAIAWAKRGVERFPIDRDALIGLDMLTNLAVIYTWTGEKDLAFEILFKLAKTPKGGIHAGDLKLNPDWDNLRNDPRFSELLEESAKPLK